MKPFRHHFLVRTHNSNLKCVTKRRLVRPTKKQRKPKMDRGVDVRPELTSEEGCTLWGAGWPADPVARRRGVHRRQYARAHPGPEIYKGVRVYQGVPGIPGIPGIPEIPDIPRIPGIPWVRGKDHREVLIMRGCVHAVSPTSY